MIFVDTAAWLAIFGRNDQYHKECLSWWKRNRELLCTSDAVLIETLNWLARKEPNRAMLLDAARDMEDSRICRLEMLAAGDLPAALKILKKYGDQGFSFTDCTNLAVMKRLRIATILTFDEAFGRYPGIKRVP